MKLYKNITKLDSVKPREFLLNFADIIDKDGSNMSIKNINEIL